MANSNERIVNGVKTRVLHGKDYVEVAERVNAVYKTNKEFETVESAPFEIAGRLVWRVVVRVDGKQHIGNAEVKLDAPKNTPDGTNPFECAETSAMGRALAFAGLGTVERIASFDEVARGQPFVAVVEQAQNKVVEAGNTPRQLPAASNGNQQPSQPATAQSESKSSTLRERFENTFRRALALKQFSFKADATDKEKIQAFLDFAGPIVNATLTSAGHLTMTRLNEIDAYLNAKDAA